MTFCEVFPNAHALFLESHIKNLGIHFQEKLHSKQRESDFMMKNSCRSSFYSSHAMKNVFNACMQRLNWSTNFWNRACNPENQVLIQKQTFQSGLLEYFGKSCAMESFVKERLCGTSSSPPNVYLYASHKWKNAVPSGMVTTAPDFMSYPIFDMRQRSLQIHYLHHYMDHNVKFDSKSHIEANSNASPTSSFGSSQSVNSSSNDTSNIPPSPNGDSDPGSKPNPLSFLASNTLTRNGIAGVTAGMVCQGIFHPLDSLKTRLQASQRGQKMTHLSLSFCIKEAIRILEVEGIGSFYAGVQPAVLASGLSWGFYFALYNSAKERLGVNTPSQYSGSEEAARLILSGIIAGSITSTLTHPLWYMKTLMQLQKRQNSPPEAQYRNIAHAFKSIVATDGVKGLFVGILPTLALVSHGVIHFVCYDLLKKYYIKMFAEHDHLLSREAFVCGGLTKMIAVGSTYPLQVVKTRLQDYENRKHNIQYKGMIDCLKRMYIQEGFWSLYRGIWPVLIRLAPQGAVTFMIYERVQEILKSF